MNFDESVKYLYSLGHETLAMKFGLENTRRLLAALGEPQKSFLKIQIAGTNGKGSVAAFLDSICHAASIKTGLFTSPHLVSITERIKINGIEITEAKFAELTSRVKETAEHLIKNKVLEALPTFFEHLTVIGLLAFAGEKVDLAILETGLGGRLDSTTAAESEIACLTPIDFDHQEYLGETLEKIAGEKAAVIHSQTRSVIISKQKPAALNVILKRCAETGIKPIVDACRFEVKGATLDGKMFATFQSANEIYENVCLNLRGRHQLENAATAIVTAENLKDFSISRAAIIEGLETGTHAGRLEIQGNILFDGAHNAAGAKALGDFLQEFIRNKITLVFGAMRDKDLSEIASLLFPLAENLILTRAENPRSAAPEKLRDFVPQNFPAEKVFVAESVSEAIKKARKIAAPKDLICVTGSLYLIGEAKSVLNS
ncbi:MAG TPA: folylpolyglutamate synthase/dihydrofolate synthase family protein [Pyrinomonadaceae bacterium]